MIVGFASPLTKASEASFSAIPVSPAEIAKKIGATMITPTSWVRMRSLRAAAARKRK